MSCDAFLNGVQNNILFGEVEHTIPYKGDNGILFERDTYLDSLNDEELDAFFDKKFDDIVKLFQLVVTK